MNLSPFSEETITFLSKHFDNVNDIKINNNSFKKIILNLFNEIEKSMDWANENFDSSNVNINKIDIVSEIPNPNGFDSIYLPKVIKKSILNNSLFVIHYQFKINARKVEILFILEDESLNQKRYDFYIKLIMSWLYFANEYSPKVCGKNLKVYIYFNSHKKVLPSSQLKILDIENVNSGLSDVCALNSEIVIFRSEEWFKVLIHEIFHNYGLDFSIMDMSTIKPVLKKNFNVNSEFAIYETYTEFWARIINLLYSTKFLNQDIKFKNNHEKFNNFYLYFKILLSYERIFTLYQCIKILNFMNLNYDDIIHSSSREKALLQYKENSNIFPYYIGVALLFINPIDFILKCQYENINLLRFKKTIPSLKHFCDYLIEVSKEKSTKEQLNKIHLLLSKSPKEILQSTRMTLIDFL